MNTQTIIFILFLYGLPLIMMGVLYFIIKRDDQQLVLTQPHNPALSFNPPTKRALVMHKETWATTIWEDPDNNPIDENKYKIISIYMYEH